jgi:hypothetical protein
VTDMPDRYYLHYTCHLEIKVEIEPNNKDEEIVECPNCKTRLRITPTAYICPKCYWDVKHNVPTRDEQSEIRITESPESTDLRKDVVECSCGLKFLASHFNHRCPKCFRQY